MKKYLTTFIIVLAISNLAAGPAYYCDNGRCKTLIETWDGGGYSWRITCSDGSYAEGTNPDGTYVGGCAMIPGSAP